MCPAPCPGTRAGSGGHPGTLWKFSHAHACTLLSNIHADPHVHIHTHTHSYTHRHSVCLHPDVHPYTCTHSHTYDIPKHTLTPIYTLHTEYVSTHRYFQTHNHRHTQACVHASMHGYTHVHTVTRLHTHIHLYTRIHIHYTYLHIDICIPMPNMEAHIKTRSTICTDLNAHLNMFKQIHILTYMCARVFTHRCAHHVCTICSFMCTHVKSYTHMLTCAH